MTHRESTFPKRGTEKWEKLGTRQRGWRKLASGRK
jgi:hypothetical protein